MNSSTIRSTIRTIAWEDGRIRLIDQTILPERFEYRYYDNWPDVVDAIRTMVVRGAPAIGCTAALGMALAARQISESSPERFGVELESAAEAFRQSRPTAVNLFWAVDRMLSVANRTAGGPESIALAMHAEALRMLDEDIET